MSAPKPITIEDYNNVGPEFFEKFNYVKTQLPADTSVEDTLTVMETLAGLVLAKREEEEEENGTGTMGFLKR